MALFPGSTVYEDERLKYFVRVCRPDAAIFLFFFSPSCSLPIIFHITHLLPLFTSNLKKYKKYKKSLIREKKTFNQSALREFQVEGYHFVQTSRVRVTLESEQERNIIGWVRMETTNSGIV